MCAATVIARCSRSGINFHDEPLALRSLRQLFWAHSTYAAFPIAVLHGHIFACVPCGGSSSTLTIDTNQKTNRLCTVGGDNCVYGLPNNPFISDANVAPALAALSASTGQPVSGTCSGPSGASHWRATGSSHGKRRVALDQHGLTALVCFHRCVIRLISSQSPEACSREHVMGLIIAAGLGAHDVLCDIMCMVLKHLRAHGERDLSEVLQLFAGDSLPAPVTLSIASEGDGQDARRMARFVFSRSDVCSDEAPPVVPADVPEGTTSLGAGQPASQSDGDDAFVASEAADARDETFLRDIHFPFIADDYSPKALVSRLLERIDDAILDASRVEIRGSIPALHQLAHICRYYLGCSATPSAAGGHEVAEMVFGRDFSPFASVARTMGASFWRLFYSKRAMLCNQRQSHFAPLELLKSTLRTIVLIQRRQQDLNAKRVAYCDLHAGLPLKSTTDAALRHAARLRANAASQHAAMQKRKRLDSASATVKLFSTDAGLRVLEGIRDNASLQYDGAAEAYVITCAAASGFRTIRSVKALDAKIATLQATRTRLSKGATASFNVDAIITLNLRNLLTLATEFAVQTVDLSLHRREGDGEKVSRALSVQGRIRKAMQPIVDSLRALVPLSPSPAVAAWTVPIVSAISGPDDIPTKLGSIIIVPGDVAYQRLITAYMDLAGAYAQLGLAFEGMSTAPRVAGSIITRLSGMLATLLQPGADLTAGSGASGLFGCDPLSLFEFTAYCDANPDAKPALAAALAHHVHCGLTWWNVQQSRFDRVVKALNLLLQKAPDPALVQLAVDKKGREHAFRYAADLVHARLTPIQWLSLSMTGKRVPVAAVGDGGGPSTSDGDDGDDAMEGRRVIGAAVVEAGTEEPGEGFSVEDPEDDDEEPDDDDEAESDGELREEEIEEEHTDSDESEKDQEDEVDAEYEGGDEGEVAEGDGPSEEADDFFI